MSLRQVRTDRNVRPTQCKMQNTQCKMQNRWRQTASGRRQPIARLSRAGRSCRPRRTFASGRRCRGGREGAARVLLRPRKNRPELAVSLRPTRPRVRERPWLLRLDFRGSIAWLGDSLSTLRAGTLPPGTQDSLPAAWLRSAGWGLHPLGLTRKGFSYVSGSHIILLSRACLAQSRFIRRMGCNRNVPVHSVGVSTPSSLSDLGGVSTGPTFTLSVHTAMQ